MKIVWRLKSATVRQVYEQMLEQRKIAYTTVMTLMNILERKKFLKRQTRERAYVYMPAKPRDRVVGAMVKDFIDRVFSGSARPLLVQLVEDRRLSEQDLAEIRRMMEDGEK